MTGVHINHSNYYIHAMEDMDNFVIAFLYKVESIPLQLVVSISHCNK